MAYSFDDYSWYDDTPTDYSTIPPAYDESDRGCWNVWIGSAKLPHTFYSYKEAKAFAESSTVPVFTDFD